ncbi:MAG: hypothetical protein OZSIB_4170 [Candidatus Ozemobacter sibiricus]|uniref:Flagellar Assembly Protein A N-terminal region domain-containing protein n=1 Tax=Candidatus Ozemobacter sibiricus TaxID=2268124 RepID=A0A367ZNJ5_9BACT|nr:MAG: hypothetical protein OZSIB_4170 [Candidatus Ozemobacter sibiricus]
MANPQVWPATASTCEETPVPGFRLEFSLNRDHTEAYLAVQTWPDGLDTATAVALIRQAVLLKFPTRAHLPFLSDELPRLAAAKRPFYGQIVARGQAPEHGQDGRVEFLVRRPSREFLVKPDGTMDFKTRDLFRSVGPGETILELHPPTDGTPGVTVFDEPIPARPGRPVRLLPGLNVVTEEGPEGVTVARAACAGQVHVEEKPFQVRVRVTPVLTVNGDVNFQTGNINFKGSAVIHGSVLTDFSVTVTGNLTIYGVIEPGAKVTAGGDLVVEKGILGHPHLKEQNPEVKAFGNIRALYVENARVTAEGDIFLRSAMNAWLSANGSIRVEKALVGGHTIALQSIVAGEIGNPAGAVTEVSAGVSHSIRTRLDLLLKILADLKRQAADVDKNLTFVQNKGDQWPEAQRAQLAASLTRKSESLADQILRLEIKKADLAIALLEDTQATISARRFYSGAILVIRSSRLRLDTDYVGVTFYQKQPEEVLEFRPYQA